MSTSGSMLQTRAQTAADKREHARVRIALRGKLFIPAEDATVDCEAVDLSAGGAGVRCKDAPPLSTFVVFYVEGFGRYEAVTTRFVNGVVGLKFLAGEAKRKRLVEKLNRFVEAGLVGVTRLRAHERVPNAKALSFVRPSGEETACEVIDISLQGLSLRTAGRPPVNELIRIGQTYGRVVRHHAEGVAVEFILADDVRAIS
ncbi:MAG TPA: PilZ domain-containing protein [Rhizomicrobium sp.]|jgi:hypothetical protein|nr:PilZ domain-containing protein [Rhizomicrobium sp.]